MKMLSGSKNECECEALFLQVCVLKTQSFKIDSIKI